MMELNGKTYEMQYLTDEETAVINAMRLGAKVQLHFFDSNYYTVVAHSHELSDTFGKRYWQDLTEYPSGHITFEAKSENVEITHFVDAKNRP